MPRLFLLIPFLVFPFLTIAQVQEIPPDFRSHNLTQYNSSLLDPTLSHSMVAAPTLSIWNKWLWQTFDGDPTNVFVHYAQKVSNETTIGIGFLQHNTAFHLRTGGNVNFSHGINFGEKSSIVLGTNIFVYSQETDEEMDSNGNPITVENSFVMQWSPGIRFNYDRFGLGLVADNVLEQHFSSDSLEESPAVFSGFASYDLDISILDEESTLRPQLYMRAIEDFDTQYGATLLLSNQKFWLQGGYNSFYGASGGLGITLFNSFSIGGLVEFGLEDPVTEESPTFEIVASYVFAKKKKAEKEEKKDEPAEGEDKLEAERLRQVQDSIAEATRLARTAEQQQQRLDSIDKAGTKPNSRVRFINGWRYETVRASDEGLNPGYYLIANVYTEERYFENFMKTLRNQGLQPNFFTRYQYKGQTYTYVYLQHYDTFEEAKAARDNAFQGRYKDRLWIFGVTDD